MIPRNRLSRALGLWHTEGKVADKPAPCRWCGANVGVEHVIRKPHRYAQVTCSACGTSGPAVRFEPSDEWPHIAAERTAIAKWDTMHKVTQCTG